MSKPFANLKNMSPALREAMTFATDFDSPFTTNADFFRNNIMKANMNSNNNIALGTTSFESYAKNQILNSRFNALSPKNPTVVEELELSCTRKEMLDFLKYTYFDDGMVYSVFFNQPYSGYILRDDNENSFDVIEFNCYSNVLSKIKIIGSVKRTKSEMAKFTSKFNTVESTVEWVYSEYGESVTTPLNKTNLPIDEMYPFLGDLSLEEYYDGYMNSNSNILLLIGPPGTGKTSFIKGLLAHSNSSAMVTYDPNILCKDSFFANYMESDTNVMVLEDSDSFLGSRSDGNTMMHKFLNVGDGLSTTKGKKLIFSTNLPSITEVDPALIRPGRCYDVLEFSLLNREQAQTLADKIGVELLEKSPNDNTYTVAEIFNSKQNFDSKKSKTINREKIIGFI